MVEERERACDEGVLSMGSEPRVYAEAVLNVCKLYVESSLDCVSGITGANLKRRIEAIMTKRTAHDLNFAKKLGLAIAALAALLGPIFIGMIHTPAAQAQSEAARPAPAPAPVAVAVSPAPTPAEKPRPRAIPVVATEPQVVAQAVVPEPQISPTATPAEARRIRGDWAQANLPNRAMAATYTQFGPPDYKERTAAAETWQYNYLEAYQSRVTIEFPPDKRLAARITWPPQSKFEGSGQDGVAAMGSHAFVEPSVRLNRVEQLMNLVVPAGVFTGRIDVIGQVKDEFGTVVTNVRDTFDSAAGTWQSSFVLIPGSFVCNLMVRELASGVMYTELIPFQVSR
jgi:hypothetical protein